MMKKMNNVFQHVTIEKPDFSIEGCDKFLQIAKQNAENSKTEFKSASVTQIKNQVHVDGFIDYYAIRSLKHAVENGADTIFIDSFGGDAFSGFSGYSFLKNFANGITTVCQGNAMSAAFMIFLAGKERLMPTEGAFLMAHLSWVWPFFFPCGKDRLMEDAKALFNSMEAIDKETLKIVNEISGSDVSEKLKEDWYMDYSDAKAHNFATGEWAPVAFSTRTAIMEEVF